MTIGQALAELWALYGEGCISHSALGREWLRLDLILDAARMAA
jgi:hypothetical protein